MAKYKLKPWLVCCFILVGLFCAVALVCLCVLSLGDEDITFKHAAVSADSERCSIIGRNILQQGGSAVDGAIAALLCTAVVNPQSMGIGGGSIVTIRDPKGNVKVYNFRETAPQAVKSNLLNNCPREFKLVSGPQWIGVPGELRGYEVIHKKHGKLPWAKLFEPTIKLAREGIPMPPFLETLLEEDIVKNHLKYSSVSEIFCNNDKKLPGHGDTLKFPKLADTMKTVAEQGADAFYTGRIGHELIQDIKAAGGNLEMADLKSFQVREEDAWNISLGDTTMYFPPPPAGGALLAFILKLMTGFPLTPNTLRSDREKILMYHHFIEACKFANGQKTSICDPAFNNGKSAAHLTNPSFINRIRGMIFSNRTHENSYYSNAMPTQDHVGTTHVSVIDEDGLAVSATSTINHLFGGGIYSRNTGIILNNELVDFCGRTKTVRAGEQPPSSMAPVIMETGSGGLLVIGGSGGSMITSAVALSIINRVWLGMKLKDAISAPIVFVNSSYIANFEPHFSKTVKDGLQALGHKPGNWKYFLNVVNAVEKESGRIVAVSDYRKKGMPAGY